MSRLVFLVEEYSMKVLLEGLLPRLFPNLSFLCIPHEGKQDLEKSVPKKLRAWREIEKLVPGFQKVSGARRMAFRLSRERNSSPSFRALMESVERAAAAAQRDRREE